MNAQPDDMVDIAPHTRRCLQRRMAWTLGFAWSGWILCLLAWGLIFHQVESVLVSGPVILFCGFGGMWLARRARHRGALWLGAANCGICLLFIGLVNLLHWSPRHADRPFRIMGAAYVLATLPAAILVTRAAPGILRRNLAQLGGLVCEQCGYDLRGQIDPRCPECGLPFDPRRLAQGPPTTGEPVTSQTISASSAPR